MVLVCRAVDEGLINTLMMVMIIKLMLFTRTCEEKKKQSILAVKIMMANDREGYLSRKDSRLPVIVFMMDEVLRTYIN